MWRWMKKNRWLALGLVAVMLFTLLPTNLNWADIAIGEPERASSETRPTEDEKSEETTTEAVTSEVTATEAVTSSETTETVTETADSTTEAVTVQGTTAADMEETTETITEASTTEIAANGEVAGSTTEANTSSSSKTSAAVKKTSGKSGEKVGSSAKPEVSKAGNTNLPLNVESATFEVNGQELKDGGTVTDGDQIVVDVHFRIDNSADQRDPSDVYVYDLNAQGVEIGDVERGNVKDGGRVVGTYWVKDGKLYVQIDDPTELAQSNIVGHVELEGVIDLGEDKVDDDKKGRVSVGPKQVTVTVNPRDPGQSRLDVSKQAGGKEKDTDGNYTIQTFTFTIKSTGENKDIELDDIFGDALELYEGPTISPAGKGTITKDTNGKFHYSIDSMKDGDTVTVTYKMKIKKDAYATKTDSDDIHNHLEYTYEDSKGNKQTQNPYYPPQADASVSKPAINKSGWYDKEEGTITWTITVDGRDLTLNGATIKDILGQYIEDADTGAELTIKWYKENDWSGTAITGKTLQDLLNGLEITNSPSTDKIARYEIQYTTKVDSDYKSSLTESFATNKAQVTVDGNIYETEARVGIGKQNLLTKTCTTSSGALEEKSEAPYKLKWKSEITVPANTTLHGLVYTDKVYSGHKMVDNSVTVTGASGTYSVSYNGSKDGFSVDFGDVTNSGSGEIKIVIEYETECDNITSTLSDYTYTNSAEITVKDGDNDIKQSASADYHYHKDSILTKGQDWNALPVAGPGEVKWSLTLKVSKKDDYTNGLVITDTLPEGMQYVDGSLRATVNGYDSYDNLPENPDGITVAQGTNGTFTITITKDALDKLPSWMTDLYIYYRTGYSDPKDALAHQNSSVINSATVTEPGKTDILGSSSAEGYVKPIGDLVYKTYKYDKTTDPYVEYTIDINKEGMDLIPTEDTLTVTDVMGNALSLVPSSLVVYQGDGVTPLGTDQYTVTYDVKTNKLVLEVPDSTHLIIKYSAEINLPVGTDLNTSDTSNTVTLSGDYGDKSQSTTQLQGSVFKSGAEITSEVGSITLWKYNQSLTNRLEGAIFEVWMMVEDGKGGYREATSADNISGYDGKKTLKTKDNVENVITGLIKDHIYAIQEVAPPAGYKLKEDQKNKVFWFILPGHDNKTLPKTLPAGVEPLDLTGNVAYIENEVRTEGYFNIGKKTQLGNGTSDLTYLPGAELSLYKETAGSYEATPALTFTTGKTTTSITVVPATETPNKDAMEIQAGNYKLVETKTPAGYKKAADITFTVDEKGNVTDVSGTSEPLGANNELVMVDDQVSIKIAKKAGSIVSGAPLSGAVLELIKQDGSTETVIQTITTDGKEVEIKGLAAGTYILREKTAPAGYEKAKDIIFTVTPEGSIKGEGDYQTYIDSTENVVTMVDTEKETDMYVSKQAIGGSNEVPGALLAIYEKDDTTRTTPVLSWESGNTSKNLKVRLTADPSKDQIAPGDYVLVETAAPDGYAYSEEIAFTITKDGEVLVNGEPADKNTIIMQDKPLEIYIYKYDISTGNPLAGATFTLKEKGTTTVLSQWTSTGDDDAPWVIPGSSGVKLKCGTTYVVEETIVPTGTGDIVYDKMEPFEFQIEKNGNIKITSANREGKDIYLDSHTPENGKIKDVMKLYNMAASPGNFVISKQEKTLGTKEIVGVQFNLECTDSDTGGMPKTSWTWTTGATPKVCWVFNDMSALNSFGAGTDDIKLIANKTYKLTEIQQAFGYKSHATKEWTFIPKLETVSSSQAYVTFDSLTSDDNIDSIERKTTTGTSAKKTYDLRVYNEMQELTISKTDITGTTEVQGAKLAIYKVDPATNKETLVENWVSDNTAQSFRLDELGHGKFVLRETGAPNGYAYAEVIKFSINDKGEIIPDTSPSDSIDATNYKITMKDEALGLKILKVSDDTPGTPLAGAKLQIEAADGSVIVDEWTSDSTAKEINGNDLKKMTTETVYYLVETTAPAGYAKVARVPFKFTEKGQVVLIDESGNSSTSSTTATVDNNNTIQLTNKPLSITIRKVDTNSTLIEGAILAVYEYENGKQGDQIWTNSGATSDTGEYEINEGSLVSDKHLHTNTTYRLVELKAPDGFAVASSILFTIKDDGTIVDVNGKTLDGNVIEMVDEQPGIRFMKKNRDGSSIEGARLRVEALDPSDSFKPVEWDSGDQAKNITGFTAGKRYVFREVTAPAGYVYAEPVQFLYTSSGQIQLVNGSDHARLLNQVELWMYDDKLELHFSKCDLGGKELFGAEMEIRDQYGNVVDKWTSTVIPHDCGSNLKTGASYTLVETVAPKGYAVTTEVKFEIKTDGSITVTGMNEYQGNYELTSYSTTGTKKNWLKLKDAPLELKINKVDENGNALPGATLQLLDETKTKVIDEWESDKDLHQVDYGLLTGGQTYILRETKTPSDEYGYSDDITITIEPDGTIKQDGEVVKDCTVTMVDYEIGVLINKEDMGGKTLPGATLQITSEQDTEFANSNWSKPWVSSEHPRNIPQSALQQNVEYVLTETTAPDGYACAESITFKIDENGNVYVKNGDIFELVTDSTVTMKDKPLELYIQKFIKGTNTTLAGAKFAILDKDTKKEVYTFTSGEQAVAVPNTALKAGTSEGRKEFILTEKEAPEGYALAPDIEFAIDRDGSIWMKGADGAYTQAENYTLNVYDEKDSLMISKQNFGGEELAGSTIIITSEEDPTFVPISFVSTNTKTLIKLDTFKRNVHYILTEIGAPAGYAYADSIIFTLDEAGNVYVNGTMVSDNTLVIKDGAIDLKVAKKIDGKDKYLSKAKLAIIDETSGDTVYSWKTKKKAEQIPGEKVKASTDTEKFIYILRETKAPKGYEKAKDIRFYIDKYGNIYTINKKGKETLVSDHIIVMNDKKSDEETDTKTATKTDSKKTGDSAPIALAGILFSLSLAGAGTAYGLRRKKAGKK